MSDGSQVGLFYAQEVSFGSGPPAAVAFKTLRFTSEGLKQNMTFAESDEISIDRSTKGVIRTSLSAAGPIGIEMSYATYDDFLAAAVGGYWNGDYLENGTLKPSFIIEKKFADIGVFHQYHGMMVDTFSLDISSNRKITGSFGFIGLNEDATGATVAAVTTPIPPTTYEMLNSIDNIIGVKEGGIAFTGCVNRIAINTNNNIRSRNCVGSILATSQGLGKMQISGVFRAHYTSRALFEKKLDQIPTSLEWTMQDASGNKYTILLPEIKYTNGQVVTGGNNQDVIADLAFTAIRDPSLGCMIQITRLASGAVQQPNQFIFTDPTYGWHNLALTSNAVTIAGGGGPWVASISGSGYVAGTLRYNLTPFGGSATGYINPSTTPLTTLGVGDIIRLRYTTPSTDNTAISATLTVGTVSDSFNCVTPIAATDPANSLVANNITTSACGMSLVNYGFLTPVISDGLGIGWDEPHAGEGGNIVHLGFAMPDVKQNAYLHSAVLRTRFDSVGVNFQGAQIRAKLVQQQYGAGQPTAAVGQAGTGHYWLANSYLTQNYVSIPAAPAVVTWIDYDVSLLVHEVMASSEWVESPTKLIHFVFVANTPGVDDTESLYLRRRVGPTPFTYSSLTYQYFQSTGDATQAPLRDGIAFQYVPMTAADRATTGYWITTPTNLVTQAKQRRDLIPEYVDPTNRTTQVSTANPFAGLVRIGPELPPTIFLPDDGYGSSSQNSNAYDIFFGSCFPQTTTPENGYYPDRWLCSFASRDLLHVAVRDWDSAQTGAQEDLWDKSMYNGFGGPTQPAIFIYHNPGASGGQVTFDCMPGITPVVLNGLTPGTNYTLVYATFWDHKATIYYAKAWVLNANGAVVQSAGGNLGVTAPVAAGSIQDFTGWSTIGDYLGMITVDFYSGRSAVANWESYALWMGKMWSRGIKSIDPRMML